MKINRTFFLVALVLLVIMALGCEQTAQTEISEKVATPPVGTITPSVLSVTPEPSSTVAVPPTIVAPAPTLVPFVPLPTLEPPPTFAPIPTPPPTFAPPIFAPSTPTAVQQPQLRHLAEKQYMLELINIEREKAGLPPVEMGDNIAAQLHAESSLRNCVSSNWGIDGLKTYMRYSLAGGYQANGENTWGFNYCFKPGDGSFEIEGANKEIDRAIEGWMGSPFTSGAILYTNHKKVNIGLAWDSHNFFAYQHFETGHIEFDTLPGIENGVLSFNGSVKNGVQFAENEDMGVEIYYDPPPMQLTSGQIARTVCHDGGRLVAALPWPTAGGYEWTNDKFPSLYKPCLGPYGVPGDAPSPSSIDELDLLWNEAIQVRDGQKEKLVQVPFVGTSEWFAHDIWFSISADIKDVLNEYGNGVYTIVVFGKVDGENIVISEYSIFHGITPPDTYTPR